MFQEKRYVTRGIMETIPIDVQVFLWSAIDKYILENNELDYLQVFELKPSCEQENNDDGLTKQIVIHKQECPNSKSTYLIQTKKPVKAKIFVIDDVTHCTMLLNNEY